jgi:hypothetical protein
MQKIENHWSTRTYFSRCCFLSNLFTVSYNIIVITHIYDAVIKGSPNLYKHCSNMVLDVCCHCSCCCTDLERLPSSTSVRRKNWIYTLSVNKAYFILLMFFKYLLPSVIRLSTKCRILNVLQAYRPPRPATGIALFYHVQIFWKLINFSMEHNPFWVHYHVHKIPPYLTPWRGSY